MGLKIALVHDYLVQDGGAERVLRVLQNMFPDAPTFTLVHDTERAHPDFRSKDIRTSFLNSWPGGKRHYQWLISFMPMAVEHLDFSGFDVVISSSSSFAKGILVPPQTTHICYCHTPTRFLWHDRIGYINDLPQPGFIRALLPPLLHRLRNWDRLAAERPDILLTNSQTSLSRIRRYYRRDAQVIHPPVDIDRIPLSTERGTYWLAGGRLVAYKRFDLIIDAFRGLDVPLKIFGVGPEMEELRRKAGPGVELLGHVSDEEKHQLYSGAIGFISPQIEDFGITAVEAMAAGKPVVAFRNGGATETVKENVSGAFFDVQSPDSLRLAIKTFDASAFDPKTIRAHAEQFSVARFERELRDVLSQVKPS